MNDTVVLVLGITLAVCLLLALVVALRSNLAVLRQAQESNADLVKALVACKAGEGTLQTWLAMNEKPSPNGAVLMEAPDPEILRNF